MHFPFHESLSHKHKRNYAMGRKLGEGGYAEVYEAHDAMANRDVAVKVAPKKLVRSAEAQLFIMNLLSQELIHPHVIRLYEWWESTHNYWMIFDLATGGELFDRLTQRGALPEAEVRLVILALLDALRFLHERLVVHRDIKPENVLLKQAWTDVDIWEGSEAAPVVLSDFGLSVQLGSPSERLFDGAGSPVYAAPEVYGNEGYTTSADIWSLGIMMFALLSGHYPFDSTSLPNVVREAKRGDIRFPDEAWSSISAEAKDFILSLLAVDPARRPTAAEAQRHVWLKKPHRELAMTAATPSGRSKVERHSTSLSRGSKATI